MMLIQCSMVDAHATNACSERVMEGNARGVGWTYTSNLSLVNGRCNDKRR